MAYTLGEAARAAGVSKTSIRRSLDAGRISGSKDEFGRWQIEPAELHRVYPPGRGVPVTVDQPVTPPEPSDIKALHVELDLLRELLEREREISRAIEADRDAWRQQATRLLPQPRRPWWKIWKH